MVKLSARFIELKLNKTLGHLIQPPYLTRGLGELNDLIKIIHVVISGRTGI